MKILATAGSHLPSISTALAAQWDYRSLNALRPLWEQLTGAAPHVILGTPPSRFTDLTSFADLRVRLLRRTIEIRDAQLALRGYVTDENYRRLRDQLINQGVTGEQFDAALEAAWLTAAVTARHRGGPFAPVAPRPVHGGSDVHSEARWLRRVDAARRSKTVTTALSKLNEHKAARQA
ncbi:DUF6545 domain-containing protein [Sphaerisporangium sp. NPDC049003]|uniref:DUF6545 domain-containing protein n=1 Tax=Sphaerisporangium sp. NPDC049003 TaxID=3364517 RepID=UPI0037181D5A